MLDRDSVFVFAASLSMPMNAFTESMNETSAALVAATVYVKNDMPITASAPYLSTAETIDLFPLFMTLSPSINLKLQISDIKLFQIKI